MRVMVLVKATQDSEAGVLPTAELLAAMGAFNDELVKAGILVDGDGLKPSRHGRRMVFDGAERTVVDGPFAATRSWSPATGSGPSRTWMRRWRG